MSKPEKPVSDKEIIDLFLNRSEEAIAVTSRRYGKYLSSIAYNILGDLQDSLECCNDAYLAVWEHIPPDKPQCFKAYIAAVVRNIALNRYKEKTREKQIPSEYVSSLDDLENYLQGGNTVDEEYGNIELKSIINGFVASLPKRKRYVFICKYYYFDTIPNIAKALKVSESTVSKDIADIKKKLKEKLIKEGYYEN